MTYAIRAGARILTGIASTTEAVLAPMNERSRAAFERAGAPGSIWLEGYSGVGGWRREDVPLAYLTRAGAFTSFDSAGSILRDSPEYTDRSSFGSVRPTTVPRAAIVLQVATLADAYVGQSVIVFDAPSAHWLPGVVLTNGSDVLMPDGVTLPASTPAATVLDAVERDLNAPSGKKLMRFRTSDSGTFVLGFADSPNYGARPRTPSVLASSPTTLGALPRDGRRILVNQGQNTDPDSAAWSILSWA